jgi:hypothetical protein
MAKQQSEAESLLRRAQLRQSTLSASHATDMSTLHSQLDGRRFLVIGTRT